MTEKKEFPATMRLLDTAVKTMKIPKICKHVKTSDGEHILMGFENGEIHVELPAKLPFSTIYVFTYSEKDRVDESYGICPINITRTISGHEVRHDNWILGFSGK